MLPASRLLCLYLPLSAIVKADQKAMKKKLGAVVVVKRYCPVLSDADGKYYQICVSDEKRSWIEQMRRAIASRPRKEKSNGKYYVEIVIWADGIA